jgi:CDP-diacylglycerol--serine O-phosphatidyltransferase
MFGRNREKRARLRAERVGGGNMNRLIPNAITVGALCAGLSGIRFAIDGRFEMAVAAIMVAAVLDGLDGRMARLLNGTSKFGAELDSLSDFLSFGVAPALIVYLWVLSAWGGLGWIVALAYAVCCALRLARFNTMLTEPNQPSWAGHFFTGVPAQAGAVLALMPLMAHFEFGAGLADRAWLQAAFARAAEMGAEAVVLFMQADPFGAGGATEGLPEGAGLRGIFAETLLPLARDWGRPVLLVHGDEHRLRSDQPFRLEGAPLANVWRLGVPGADDMRALHIHWHGAPKAPFDVKVLAP